MAARRRIRLAAALLGVAAAACSSGPSSSGSSDERASSVAGTAGGSSGAPVVRLGGSTPAAAPFRGFTETRADWGDGCRRVVVADTVEERARGLSGIDGFAPYEGMLFVFPADTEAGFTMRATRMPLHITWYAADGTPVDDTAMVPCPPDADDCPTYEADDPYRYALETAGGSGAGGSIAPCG